MKRIVTLATLAFAALLLSGCGLVNSFIPDQPAENVFGLDEKAVTLQPTAAGSQFTAQAVATYEAQVTGTFGDVDTSKIPAGIRPSGVEETLSLGGSIEVTFAASADMPQTLVVSGVDLALTLDDSSSEATTSSFSSGQISASFTKGACNLQTCTYSASAETVELMQIDVKGADFDAVWALITNGDHSNTATGTLTLTFEPAISATAIEVTLKTSNGKVKFG